MQMWSFEHTREPRMVHCYQLSTIKCKSGNVCSWLAVSTNPPTDPHPHPTHPTQTPHHVKVVLHLCRIGLTYHVSIIKHQPLLHVLSQAYRVFSQRSKLEAVKCGGG